jgi:hypothetical protein
LGSDPNPDFGLTDWILWAVGNRARTIQLAAFLVAIWVALRVWHMLRVRKILAIGSGLSSSGA